MALEICREGGNITLFNTTIILVNLSLKTRIWVVNPYLNLVAISSKGDNEIQYGVEISVCIIACGAAIPQMLMV